MWFLNGLFKQKSAASVARNCHRNSGSVLRVFGSKIRVPFDVSTCVARAPRLATYALPSARVRANSAFLPIARFR